jgi:hypothetical protein
MSIEGDRHGPPTESPPTAEGAEARLGELTEGGIELAGALAGGGLGLVGGPAGALGGAALGVALTRGLKTAVSRLVTHREEQRMSAAVVLIAEDAKQRAEHGDRVRDDDFFDEHGRLRPDGEELLEGVLRHAAQTYEERKVLTLARFYSGLAHDKSVDAPQAHLLLRQVAALTYRQIVALSVFAQRSRYSDFLIQTHAMHTETSGHPGGDPTIQAELSDLAAVQLLGAQDSSGQLVPVAAIVSGAGNIPANVGYGRLALLSGGETIARLARLTETVSDAERDAWLEALRGPSSLDEL